MDCPRYGGHAKDPPVKRIVALLVPRGEREILTLALELLRREWGEPQRQSGLFPFEWTNYYQDIAPQLDRCFFSYHGLYPMSELPNWKIRAAELERATGDSRRVNIDPGTLDGARLLLASTKGQAQRIYLRDGIFAEVTLCRRKGRWESFFYTYPDFKSTDYYGWLDLVRSDWKREYRELTGKGSCE